MTMVLVNKQRAAATLGGSASVRDPNTLLHMMRDRCAQGRLPIAVTSHFSWSQLLNVWSFAPQTFDASQQEPDAAEQQSPAFVPTEAPRHLSPMPTSAPQDDSDLEPDSPPRPQKYGRDTALK